MRLVRLTGSFCLLLALSLSAKAQAVEDMKSGPQAGQILAGSFTPFNINGKHKGGYHCLVCEYDANPVVVVFAREPAAGKDEALNALLKKLDEAVERHQNASLHGFVVFLSPAAHSSATAPAAQDAGKLQEEADAREKLTERLQTRAENLKHLVITFFPAEGPNGYKINDKAETTILLYKNYQVLDNKTFKDGRLQARDVDALVKKIDDTLFPSKKINK